MFYFIAILFGIFISGMTFVYLLEAFEKVIQITEIAILNYLQKVLKILGKKSDRTSSALIKLEALKSISKSRDHDWICKSFPNLSLCVFAVFVCVGTTSFSFAAALGLESYKKSRAYRSEKVTPKIDLPLEKISISAEDYKPIPFEFCDPSAHPKECITKIKEKIVSVNAGKKTGSGGYVLKSNGLGVIMTSAHVVSDGYYDKDEIFVQNANGSFTAVDVVCIPFESLAKKDFEFDYAYLFVNTDDPNFTVAMSDKQVEKVYIAENSQGDANVVPSNIVKRRDEGAEVESVLWRGASGSLVIDNEGRLVGVYSGLFIKRIKDIGVVSVPKERDFSDDGSISISGILNNNRCLDIKTKSLISEETRDLIRIIHENPSDLQ